MKTTIKTGCKPEEKYPCLKKSKNGLVVLFEDPGAGMVVVKGDSTYVVGSHSRCWSGSEFAMLSLGSQVILEND